MKEAIIFGCGGIGTLTYDIINQKYKVRAWVDNNPLLWGKKKNGIRIISPDEMRSVIKKEDCMIFVAVTKALDIINQLNSYGYKDFYVWKGGTFFFNTCTGEQLNYGDSYSLELNRADKNILFVMNTILGGIREYRLAKILKKKGYKIYLAYMMPIVEEIDDGFTDVYEKLIQITSLQDLKDLVNLNNFEFIHSSSEPEWATGYLIDSNKKIIHECHDLGSSNVYMTASQLGMEFIANIGADGVIYPSEKLRDDAIKKYRIPIEKTLVIENYISETLIPNERKEKLSVNDGQMHAVYEGAISAGDEFDKRFFEKIWVQIANEGIHVHFYTNHNKLYCKYLETLHENIHYEGNLSSKELAAEMTRYDLGLLLFNVNPRNKLYLEYASPNKLYEYINSGIPVATSGIKVYQDFVEKNGVGGEIDFKKELYSQFKKISELDIRADFLIEKKLTIESNEEKIMGFINKVSREGY